MRKNVFLSILIPTWNRSDSILALIESSGVIDNPIVEFVVVDNFSEEKIFINLKKLILKYSNIRLFRNEKITFKDASGNNVDYSCSSTNKLDFANKIKTHVNNHICKNVYRANRGCMELTGGYIEETIAVDVTTGRKKCAIYVSTFVDKKLNDAPWQYGGTIFEMPSWC